ncbi:MAG: helix-turn-helix transcriptional regulator [Anaeroplasmataceae bacterium]|nr:helix-turn-helix transcriptional regulator [Anaeroplasmataceae bacterium]
MREKLKLQNNLKAARISHGYSQEKLAELVGTTRQTIIAIEKQIFNPTAKLALLLCIALDCKFEDLFYF